MSEMILIARDCKLGGVTTYLRKKHTKTYPSWEQRFWTKIKVTENTNDCWEWQGTINADGYGKIFKDKKSITVSRLMFELTKGQIPEGYGICHKCDNRKCVNPTHLFSGTPADNRKDCIEKGRARYSPTRKLTKDQVMEIIKRVKAGETQIAIAPEYGIAPGTISAIFQGKNWKGALCE